MLHELISSNEKEIRSCFKLTMNHFTVEGPKRQNVRMAAALLTHRTATALRHYYPENTSAENIRYNFVQAKIYCKCAKGAIPATPAGITRNS
jgi:hypothetical protein